ncbi:2044_t:CDS:2, partial [Diversispora eburnea]
TIIQIPKWLQKIYPNNYQISEKELLAWKAMHKSCGCSNVTPFEKNIFDLEFWSRAIDPSGDKETLLDFYNSILVQLENENKELSGIIDSSNIFWENFRVGSTSLSLARKHARLNGPDKSNVLMSSYKVDAKTNLPILYLQDQKQASWYKFEEIYPNGMKKTSFMTRLANYNHIKYWEDLGGLCLICNDYGFEVFQNLIAIARNTL